MFITPSTQLYYINLDDNLKRKISIENMLVNLGFTNCLRIPAVNTKTFDNVLKYKNLIKPNALNTLIESNETHIRHNHYELTNGAVGCYLSHMEIYAKMVSNDIPYAIILEDDVEISTSKNDFWRILPNIKIPEDCDIFLINVNIYDLHPQTISPNIKKINFFFGTHFYILTLAGAKKLIKHLFPIQMQIDSQLARLSYDKIINIYTYTNKNLGVVVGRTPSDVQSLECPTCNIYTEISNYINKREDFINIGQNNMDDLCKNVILLLLVVSLIILYFCLKKK
jgi:GR25 family glycosyltransferase involved in LPS biosynthesis